MIQGILIGIVFILVCILSRSITTLIHELGHALPALLFTKEEVTIYIGSYGDLSKSYRIKIGRLISYLKLNLFSWDAGLCTHRGVTTTWQKVIIILGGPLFSVLLSIGLLSLLKDQALSQIGQALVGLFVISSVFDFFVNVIPAKNPMILHTGEETFNDGTQLLKIFRTARYPESYHQAVAHYNNNDLPACITELKKVMDQGKGDTEIFQFLLRCLMEEKSYDEVEKQINSYEKSHPLKVTDSKLIGKIKMDLGKYKAAIPYFNKALYLSYKDSEMLNLRGECLMQLGEHEIAKKDFHTALFHHPDFIRAMINRGITRIKTGERAAGYEDLMTVIKREPNNPTAYLNLGFYFDIEEDYEAAIQHFERAKQLGLQHHGLDFYIAQAKKNAELK